MCAAAATMRHPADGLAMPASSDGQTYSGKSGGPKLIHMINDDGKTGRILGGWKTELQDGKWMRSGSEEAKNWNTMREIETGTAPPPDKVNNRRVNNQQPGVNKSKLKTSSGRRKVKTNPSYTDRTGNITKDADLKSGGINI